MQTNPTEPVATADPTKHRRIQLVINQGRKLDALKPLFELLANKRHGKLTDSYFIVSTDVSLQARNNLEAIFTELQTEAFSNGFGYVCYCFNIVT